MDSVDKQGPLKILVTGAAGFIGSHLADKLSTLGHEVTGIDNFSDYYDPALKQLNVADFVNNGGTIEKIDLRNAEALQTLPADFDYIFHLAAQSGISATSTFENYFSNNVVATKNLLDFSEKNKGLKLLVNISTSSVYGFNASFDENKVPQPVSYYGVSKLTAEQLVLSYSRKNSIKACSLRLFSVYGPRERPEKLYSLLIRSGFNNTAFPLYENSEKHSRSFTYVGDIINGLISVIGKEELVNNEVINIGSPYETTTQEGIDVVEKLLNKKITIHKTPPRNGDQLFTRALIDKARSLLQYEPLTRLEEGIKAQIEWYKQNFESR